ncbi:aminotransferase class I/II-fold pyridoxal phosphate-dependent enzyme [Alphaproteobacteria bacterium]|nr:aminotransferase class I/II-fold pyridoxal phosphate-dependent enzyme [Alphaproteobacteria bacterium]
MITHSKPWINHREIKSITSFLQKKNLSSNAFHNIFERNLKKKFGIKNAVFTKSGTDALINAIKLLKLKKNDEVILPSYVCKNVLHSLTLNKVKPVFCDIGENWVITFENIKKCLSKKTKGIIIVHTFGHPCNIKEIKKLNIPIIEDACQAIGLKIGYKYSGTLGDLGVYSFDSTKCLTTIHGGMLICNNDKYINNFLTIKSKLDNSFENSFSPMQANLGISQLKRYDQFIQKRKYIYQKFIKEFIKFKSITIKKIRHNYLFRFTFRTNIPFKILEKKYRYNNIIIRKGVDEVLHKRNKKNDSNLTNTILFFNTTVSIPFYPSLTNIEINRIIKISRKIFNEYAN